MAVQSKKEKTSRNIKQAEAPTAKTDIIRKAEAARTALEAKCSSTAEVLALQGRRLFRTRELAAELDNKKSVRRPNFA
jgi:hypothetical protein